MSFTDHFLQEQDYMRRFFGNERSLQPDLQQMGKDLDRALEEETAATRQSLIRIIEQSNQQADGAIEDIYAQFAKGATSQIQQLKQTAAKIEERLPPLKATLGQQEVAIQNRMEKSELLQRQLAEMNRFLRSDGAKSSPTQETVNNIGTSAAKNVGNI